MHLYNPWNDGKPVKIGRDGQVLIVSEETHKTLNSEYYTCLIFPGSRESRRRRAVSVICGRR